MKSMKFKKYPVVDFISSFSPAATSEVFINIKLNQFCLRINILIKVECGSECLETDGCLTMRWLNNACDLGGFHPSSDGDDSEECYFNDGELVKYMIKILSKRALSTAKLRT